MKYNTDSSNGKSSAKNKKVLIQISEEEVSKSNISEQDLSDEEISEKGCLRGHF